MKDFDFKEYDSLKELFKKIYYRNLPIEDAEKKQDKFMAIFNATFYVTARKSLLIHAKKFYDGRKMIISAFKKKIFPINPEEVFFEDKDVHRDDEDKDEDGF